MDAFDCAVNLSVGSDRGRWSPLNRNDRFKNFLLEYLADKRSKKTWTKSAADKKSQKNFRNACSTRDATGKWNQHEIKCFMCLPIETMTRNSAHTRTHSHSLCIIKYVIMPVIERESQYIYQRQKRQQQKSLAKSEQNKIISLDCVESRRKYKTEKRT